MIEADVIIIGGGIMGSATANSLAVRGVKVVLLEQFPLFHTQGSSHGDSRIIRKTYAQQHFSNLMETAYPLWARFEKETGSKLYYKTGGLDFGPESSPSLQQTIEVCKGMQSEYRMLSHEDLREKYP